MSSGTYVWLGPSQIDVSAIETFRMETNHSTEKTFHKAFSDWLRYLSYLIDACRQLWGYSSVVEHSTADREVLGSNPSVPCHFHFQFRVASFFCILSCLSWTRCDSVWTTADFCCTGNCARKKWKSSMSLAQRNCQWYPYSMEIIAIVKVSLHKIWHYSAWRCGLAVKAPV